MFKSKHSLIIRAVGLAVLMSAATLIARNAYFAYESAGLLDQAIRVATMDGWRNGKRFNVSVGVHWISDRMVLFDRFVTSGAARSGTRVAYRRDIVTGDEKRLDSLSQALVDLGAESVDSQAVSPNGKWIAVSSRWGPCMLAEIDGPRRFFYPPRLSDCYRRIFWLDDGFRWLESYVLNDECRGMVLHDIRQPRDQRLIVQRRNQRVFAHIDRVQSLKSAVGVQRSDWDDVPGMPFVTITRLSLGDNDQMTDRGTLKVNAPHADHFGISASHDGRHLAWETLAEREGSLSVLFHRIANSIQPVMYRQYEIWVSSVDGSNMRQVGSTSETVPLMIHGEPPTLQLQWLPGGRKLGFEYKGALYTVRAF